MTRRLALRQGFTLIELLVVITVISVLISALLPALGQARQAAYKSICAGNFRQIGFGCFSYAADNKQCFPNINDGQGASLGLSGLGYQPGYNGLTWDQICDQDLMCTFSRDYMSSTWGWDQTAQLVKVPKVFVCPGLPPSSVSIPCPLFPGEVTGYHPIGCPNAGYANGTVVGFGSFLGLNQGGVSGENLNYWTAHCLNIRSDLMTHASDDPIIVDLLLLRFDLNVYLVPHGTGAKPSGTNEVFADGSQRWFSYDSLNTVYFPSHAEDRKCLWLLNNPVNGQLLKGGYPQYYTYDYVNEPDPNWFGIANPYAQSYTP